MTIGLLTMAGGIVIVKPLFTDIPLFWIITIRMAAGVFGSVVMLKVVRNRGMEIKKLFTADRKFIVISGFLLSSYVSISLWIAGYKFLPASLASVLNQTSTIFTVIFASLILRSRSKDERF